MRLCILSKTYEEEKKLIKYLQLLITKKGFAISSPNQLLCGMPYAEHVHDCVVDSDIVVALVDNSFLADRQMHELEMLAVNHKKPIIPVILKKCSWELDSLLEGIYQRPRYKGQLRPVYDWRSKDDAYQDVVNAILETVELLNSNFEFYKNSGSNKINKSQNPNVDLKDVFICHASEDKKEFVEPLITRLDAIGITYWYDNAQIKWGDSIVKKVNEGLLKSKFVIVVISKNSLDKQWPNHELESALNLELGSNTIKVLPIILGSNDDAKKIISNYPILNGKLYKRFTNNNFGEIVNALKERLN